MKRASDSNTLRGAVLALAAAVVAMIVGILTAFGVLEPDQAAVVTGLAMPVLGAAGAVWAAYGRLNPLIKPIGKPKRPKGTPSGGATVLIVLSALAAFALAGSAGCGSTFECVKAYERQLKPTAPFTDNARCDGDEVFRASGPIAARFVVRCQAGQVPAIDRGGVVTCVRTSP